MLERSVEVAESRGFVARHALRLAYISEAYALAGRHDRALDAGTRALQLATLHEERANQAYSLRVLAQLERDRGDRERAEQRFDEALRLARELGMRPLEARCRRGLSLLLTADGKVEEAAEQESMATTSAASMKLCDLGDPLVDERRQG
jgi:tetratricopeptide (TPR) repeat protein